MKLELFSFRPGRSAIALVALAPVLACVTPTFRPIQPRRSEAAAVTVSLTRANLRTMTVDLEVAGGSHPVLDGAWVVDRAASGEKTCERGLAAATIEKTASSVDAGAFRARFPRSLIDALERPTNLEVRVTSDGAPPTCLALPMGGESPDDQWTVEPAGRERWFAGRDIDGWFSVSGGRSWWGVDWLPLRVGRRWGPIRLSGGAGLGSAYSPDQIGFVIPTALTADAFPIVKGRLGLGFGASYDLRPTWTTGNFELVHGPVGSVELAYVAPPLPGFLEGTRVGIFGLAFSVGRWFPDGGATVMILSLKIN